MASLIGSSGLIGRVLNQHQTYNQVFNSNRNIVINQDDFLVIAAPTSNRLWVNAHPSDDQKNIDSIIELVHSIKPKRIILISTVDSLHAVDTNYGKNRKFLEDFVKNTFHNHHIIRLCTLIHPAITKNVLYDLKHQQFLDYIPPALAVQWYDLSRLPNDMTKILEMDIKEINLVSEPIANQCVVDKFFPAVKLSAETTNRSYDLKCDHSTLLGGSDHYLMSKSQVFDSMRKYLSC